MFERLSEQTSQIDRESLLVMGLLPAAATIVAMAVAFSIVGGLLLAWEVAIVGRLWTRILALGVMYLLPQFVVGIWMGTRHGLSAGPPIAAGIAPVVVLVVTLGAFGGPVSTPFETPALTITAIVIWSLICACGLLVGANVVAPRYGKQAQRA